jgi:hypothetical protein
MIASTNLKNQLPLPSLTPNNALRRNAPPNGLPAKRIPNVSPLFRTVKRSVEPVNHAGLSASHPRAAKQQSIPLSALMPINALAKFLSPQRKLLSLSLTPNNALRRNAPHNGLTAKRTPNASPLFRIAKRNVEPVNHAGLSASHPRAAKLQSM